jgi:folate/biopterin transporter
MSPYGTFACGCNLRGICKLQIATCDLLCEGKYAELMQQKPHTGSTMVSYVWGCFQVGALIASIFVGPVADAYDPQIIFWFCIPLAASIIVPTSMGFLSDERVPLEKRGLDWDLLNEHPYIVAFCLIMASIAFGNALIDLFFFDAHFWQMIYCMTACVGLSVLAFRWLPPHLARCNFYMFISCVLYINISGAQDFWFTGDQKCVPGGPSFDYTYYNTYASLVGSITGWVGIVLFQAVMSDWNFRTLFWVTTVIQIIASMFDMLMIARINIDWGISDKAFYMFGDAVIGNVVGMFGLMPMLVLTSKLVPKGLEATTYALLAGFQNFGGVVSSQIGIYATQAFGIKTKEPCNFDNLNMLVFICHCLLPLIAVPLTFVLIPNKSMTDKIIDDNGKEIVDEDDLKNPA